MIENKSSQINHIQTPKSILKEFSKTEHIINNLGFPEKHNMVYQMNVNGEITKKDIKECNAEKGFYSQYKEAYLANIESLFGDVKSKILKSDLSNAVVYSEEETEIVKAFFTISLSRSQNFRAEILKESEFASLLYGNIDEFIMQHIEEDIDWFGDCTVSLIINRTKVNFVLPQKCWYKIVSDASPRFVSPVSPKIAVVLQRNKSGCLSASQNIFLEQNEDIYDLNEYAIRQEMKVNKGAVFAKEKEDLEKYVQYLKELKV